jgi:hypothetical protein
MDRRHKGFGKHRERIPIQRDYWWVWCIRGGRAIRRGAYLTEQEAHEHGLRELGSDIEVIKLPTRDPNRARDIIRNIILERSKDIEFSLRRFRNKL